jgi:hypothetical protein
LAERNDEREDKRDGRKVWGGRLFLISETNR